MLVLKIVFALYALHCSGCCKKAHYTLSVRCLVEEHTDAFGHYRCVVVLITQYFVVVGLGCMCTWYLFSEIAMQAAGGYPLCTL